MTCATSPLGVPDFLREYAGADVSKPVIEVPRIVAIAAARALGCPTAATRVALTPRAAAPCLGRSGAAVAARSSSLRAQACGHGPYRKDNCIDRITPEAVNWPCSNQSGGLAEKFQRASDVLSLVPEQKSAAKPARELSEGAAPLRFGDVIHLTQHRNGLTFALSTVPYGCAEEAERRVSSELQMSGRKACNFLSVTASLMSEEEEKDRGALGRRSVWELHRAEPLDGYPLDGMLRYGQPFRLGQRQEEAGDDEMMLVCEPPAIEGGGRAPYLMSARRAGFGFPHPRSKHIKKVTDTAFQFLEVPSERGSSAGSGTPVDVSQPLLLVACSPAAHGHEPRFMRTTQAGLAGVAGSGGRAVRSVAGISFGSGLGGKEVLVEAADRSQLAADRALSACWQVRRLTLPQTELVACENRRTAAHDGLPRALLGRALAAPPDSVAQGRAAKAETAFSRWEIFRRTLLPRVDQRGMTGFAFFRKALIARAEPVIKPAELAEVTEEPVATNLSRPLEVSWVSAAEIQMTFLTEYGLKADDDLLLLMAASMGKAEQPASGHPRDELKRWVIDVDVLADALRGMDVSPCRTLCLERLYAQLQGEAQLPSDQSLDLHWIERRLYEAIPPETPGMKDRTIGSPQELLRGIPVLRSYRRISQSAFVRWISDLCYNLPDHVSFAAKMEEMWGTPLPASAREARLWQLPRKPVFEWVGEACAPLMSGEVIRNRRRMSRMSAGIQ
eukprot:TRINITY_DN33744_c0_g2_i1.p1 TRINITY_DN33744_c0_g2~~TRINITY_DN33744_c0_g2_i1.p1  ORF type:complete len:729 (-),score=88.99 TRINITY_DN33744_c0_g2_i1:123-2309(-)